MHNELIQVLFLAALSDGQLHEEEKQLIAQYTKFYPIFKDAVQESIKRSETGDVVLLSPSCSSYDQFNNFEHRGEYFKFLVTKL